MVIETSVLVSAGAGLASFLSPCILPILPGFISYLSGTAINEAKSSTQDTSTTSIPSNENVGNIESNSDGGGLRRAEATTAAVVDKDDTYAN